MKMLGFMIALTLVYWVMASYAQSLVRIAEPCPSAVEFAAASAADANPGAGARETVVRLQARWSQTDAYETTDAADPASCAG
ncbi:hypothetical protein [Hyphococcus sp.]|jgi:hypothetical protein|uniref:hypothetical protein n=1 Tax=Hyphococcus sp. TaxID=2038636 RepID=UPI003D1010AD